MALPDFRDHHAGRSVLIGSPARVFAHLWSEDTCVRALSRGTDRSSTAVTRRGTMGLVTRQTNDDVNFRDLNKNGASGVATKERRSGMASWPAGEIEVNGLRLHYTRTGGAKPPV